VRSPGIHTENLNQVRGPQPDDTSAQMMMSVLDTQI